MADDSSGIELSKLSSSKTRNTGLLNRIDLPNEFPPEGNDEDDFPAILKVRLMPEGKYITFAIQSYYRMGKVLLEVQKHFQVEGDDYCFSAQNFELVKTNDTFNRLNLLDMQDI